MTAVETETPNKVENPLFNYVRDRIAQNGPMPFDEYMAISSQGAVDDRGIFIPGYYSGGRPNIAVGEGKKDFSTAPEGTPLFGFLLARQIQEMRARIGFNKPFTIVEMGGGNGTLARDILTASKEFYGDTGIKYVIVDSSPHLGERQREALKDFDVEFIQGSAMDSLPGEIEGVVLSNELFDDLPSKSFYRNGKGEWKELFVRQDPNPESPFELDNHWEDATQDVLDYIARNAPNIPSDTSTIASIQGENLMAEIARKLKRGFVITVDYALTEKGGSHDVFPLGRIDELGRIIRNTPYSPDVFGKVGITARVDFEALNGVAQDNGLTLELDQPTSLFFKEIGYEVLRSRLEHMYEEKPEEFKRIVGRQYSTVGEFGDYASRAIEKMDHRILIHSKGV